MPIVPKSLFLCRGRRGPRSIWWSPLFNDRNNQKLWEMGTYVDTDPLTRPDHVLDVTNASPDLFKEQFDMIIAVQCPHDLFQRQGKVTQQFWNNVASWLKPGGVFLTSLSLNAQRVRPDVQVPDTWRLYDSTMLRTLLHHLESTGQTPLMQILDPSDVFLIFYLFRKLQMPVVDPTAGREASRLKKILIARSKAYESVYKWLASGHQDETHEKLAANVASMAEQVQLVTQNRLVNLTDCSKWVKRASGDKLGPSPFCFEKH